MNTFTLGACFQHELHTGPHLLLDYIWSYGCPWEVWRALKKLELHSAIASCNSYASFVLSKLLAKGPVIIYVGGWGGFFLF